VLRDDFLRIRPAHERVQVQPVLQRIHILRRTQVSLAVRGRVFGIQIEHDAYLAARTVAAEHRDRPAVPEEQVMRRRDGFANVLVAGRVVAPVVAEQRADRRLVQRHPVLDPVAQPPRHRLRILRERLRGVPRRPAALVLQRLRQVPMVQRRVGRDARGQQAVHEPAVEIQPHRVDLAVAARQDARPANREPVRLEPQLLHQRDILAPAMVVVTGHIARIAVKDAPRRVREAIPDALTLAVLVPGPLDLVRRSCRAPPEVARKTDCHCHTP